MPVFRVTSPDGRTVEVTAPEGATEQQAIQYAQDNWETLSKSGTVGEFAQDKARKALGIAPEGATFKERALAEPGVRALMGAVSPIVGAFQAGANIGDYLAEKLGLPSGGGAQINKHLADLEAEKQKAMEASGKGTTDVAGLVGGMVSGAPIGKAIVSRLGGPSAIIAGRAAQGAATGAAMGATAPVTSGATGERYFDEKGNEILLGGVTGAALEPLLRTVAFVSKYPYHLLERFLPGGKEVAAGRAMGKAAGPQKPAVISELEKPRELVPGAAPTAGEAATAAQSPGFAALQKAVTGVDVKSAGEYGKMVRAQEQARSVSLSTKPAEAFSKEREALTAPIRELALKSAKLAGTKGADVISGIDRRLAEPALAASSKAPILQAVRDKINQFTNLQGVIDPDALYTIRKDLNQTIETLLGGSDVSGNKRRAAQIAAEIRPMIDKAIDGASKGEWSRYMGSYRGLSKKVDQAKILQHLSDRLDPALEGGKQRASAFAKAMADAPRTIEASTEFAGYKNLEDVLTPEQLKSVNGVLADLNRQSEFERLAKEGGKAIGKQIGQVGKEVEPIGGTLNRAITLASAVIRRIQGGVGEKTLADISEIMQDPKRAAQVMRAADESERKALLTIARATSPKAVGAAMGGVESTAAERQRRKAERAAKEAVQ